MQKYFVFAGIYSDYFCMYFFIPVSYTHLDVYKRQVQAGSGTWGMGWGKDGET